MDSLFKSVVTSAAVGIFFFGVNRLSALDGSIGVHDPSTVAVCDGSYYVFGTGRGIPILSSTNGFNWTRAGQVFDRVPDSVRSYVPKNNGSLVWAPDVIKLNGEYFLYYSISAWGQFVSAVGLMTNPTLNTNSPNYKWTDRGMVVHSSEGEDLNAIDPGVVQSPDGSLWICYGSYHGDIELVELDPKTGLRIATNSPVSVIANHSEAADIIFHDGYFYLFVNHGSCCQGANSAYNIRVGRAKKVTGPYLDRHGESLTEAEGTLFLAAEGNRIGPGHFGLLIEDGVEKFSCHYEAVIGRPGRSVLDIRPLLWTLDGWPVPGENLREGTFQMRSQRSDSVLEIAPGETNSSPVHTARYLSRDHQKWTIVPDGGGFYKIFNGTNAMALQVTNESVGISTFADAENQLWKIDQFTDGSYRLASKSNKLVLAALVKSKPGNAVAVQPFTGDDSQRWIITVP